MKKENFVKNRKFLNFVYHALASKLEESISNSEFCNDIDADELIANFWGDFFEQIMNLDRHEVLRTTYKRLSDILKEDLDISDPEFANILYNAELAQVCGYEELEISEIYQLQKASQ